MILVLGITGRIGGGVAQQLLAQGQQVRALVRDRAKAHQWEVQGVELVEGDWADAQVIQQALQGVDRAFFMLPPVYLPSREFTESQVLITAFGTALRSVSLSRLVVLSSNGAEQTSGLGAITPLSLLERELGGLPYPHIFIRPGAFYENFLSGLQTAQQGIFSVFYDKPGEKHAMTAISDITRTVTDLLIGPAWMGQRVIELGSMVSANELAEDLGSVLGRKVTAQVIPREAWASTLEQMGFPRGQTWAFEGVYDGVNAHWIGFGVEGTERIEGTTSAREVFAAAQQATQAQSF